MAQPVPYLHNGASPTLSPTHVTQIASGMRHCLGPCRDAADDTSALGWLLVPIAVVKTAG